MARSGNFNRPSRYEGPPRPDLKGPPPPDLPEADAALDTISPPPVFGPPIPRGDIPPTQIFRPAVRLDPSRVRDSRGQPPVSLPRPALRQITTGKRRRRRGSGGARVI